jgi:hypothetical protein
MPSFCHSAAIIASIVSAPIEGGGAGVEAATDAEGAVEAIARGVSAVFCGALARQLAAKATAQVVTNRTFALIELPEAYVLRTSTALPIFRKQT